MIATDIKFNQQAFFPSTIPVNISDAQVKKHIRDSRVRQLKDKSCSLYLRFNAKRTGGTWWYYRYKDGKQQPYRIGTYPATQAKDIKELLSAATIQIVKGEQVQCNRLNTVDLLLEWYVKREENNKTSSKERITNLKSMVDRYLIGVFHGVSIADINHELIDTALIGPMFDEGYSISYLRAMFSLVKTAFTTAKRLKQITINPMAELKFSHFVSKSVDVKGCRLRVDQLPYIISNLVGQEPEVRMLLTMMLAHGSRIGETRKSKWENISFSHKYWNIPKEDTKNGQGMQYPLTESMVELLQSYRAQQNALGYHGDYLFPISPRQNKPAYPAKASGWVRGVSQRKWSAHDLRKIARTIWADIGIDYIVAETLLNHAKGKLDQAYIHTHMETQKKQALEHYHEWLKKCWYNCFTTVSMDP